MCLRQQLLLFAAACVLYIGMLGIRGPLPTFVVLVHFVMLNIVVSNSVSANRIWRLLCLELRILNNSCSEILLLSLTTLRLVTEGNMSSRILIRSSRAIWLRRYWLILCQCSGLWSDRRYLHFDLLWIKLLLSLLIRSRLLGLSFNLLRQILENRTVRTIFIFRRYRAWLQNVAPQRSILLFALCWVDSEAHWSTSFAIRRVLYLICALYDGSAWWN